MQNQQQQNSSMQQQKEQRDNYLMNLIANSGGDVRLLNITDPTQRTLRETYKKRSNTPAIWARLKATVMQGYDSQVANSNNILNNLESFHKEYTSTPDIAKGPLFGTLSKLSPDGQEAAKNASRLVLEQTAGLKGFSRITNNMMGLMQTGTVGMKLSPEAEQRLYEEIKLSIQRLRVESDVAHNLAGYIEDPSVIQDTVSRAGQTYDTIDENGTLHPENLIMISMFASPVAAIEVTRGKHYLPEDVSDLTSQGINIENLRESALVNGIPFGVAIQRVRMNLQKKNAQAQKNVTAKKSK
jgi:hypothetical protein